MKTPHPERVHVSRHAIDTMRPFSYGGVAYMPAFGEQLDTVATLTYAFSYRRPFTRPYSISLGAAGLVRIDQYSHETQDGSRIYGSTVDIRKSVDGNSEFRDPGFSQTYVADELEARLLDEFNLTDRWDLFDGLGAIEVYKTMARIAVADVLVRYSNAESLVTIFGRL